MRRLNEKKLAVMDYGNFFLFIPIFIRNKNYIIVSGRSNIFFCALIIKLVIVHTK